MYLLLPVEERSLGETLAGFCADFPDALGRQLGVSYNLAWRATSTA